MLRTLICYLLAAVFLVAGVLHFTLLDAFASIVPPALPFRRLIVQLTGVIEIVLALGLLLPRTRAATGWLLSAYLVAVLPANIYMAVARIPLGETVLPDWALWFRVLLQFPLIGLVLWACRSFPTRASLAKPRRSP